MIYGSNNAETIVDTVGNGGIDAQGGNDLIILANEQTIEEIYGGAGQDTISLVNLYSVSVDIGDVTQGYGWVGQTYDLLDSIENVIATNGADSLFGNAGANELFARGGNDFLEGRGGADKLDGGSGFDTASYEHATVGVTVTLDNGFGYGGEAQGDRLFGIEGLIGSSKNDLLAGNALRNMLQGGGGEDLLAGNDGNDVLNGGAAHDWLYGGRGADNLTGGGSADTFLFEQTTDSYYLLGHTDTITDFNHSVGDRIDLSAIDAKPGQAGNQAFSYIGANAFSAVGQIRAHTDDGNMIVEVNASSQAGAEMTIIVADVVTLISGDFIL